MFISEYIKQKKSLSKLGVFDALIDKDSNFFINIIRLKNSAVPEFIEAYSQMNSFFCEIATLLDSADKPELSDKMYKGARRRFVFHEVNGINLGFSESSNGAGWGDKLSDKVLSDAYQIVKKGSKQSALLLGIFRELKIYRKLHFQAEKQSDSTRSLIFLLLCRNQLFEKPSF